MSNVLDESIQQQVMALGRLGWSLRRIEAATGVRRETISGYLRAAGIAVRRRGGRPAQWPPQNPATTAAVSTDLASHPVSAAQATPSPGPGRAPTASACEPYRDQIVEGLRLGRNAMAIWQDLVDGYGFLGRYASVRRFVAPCSIRCIATCSPTTASSHCHVECAILTQKGKVESGVGHTQKTPLRGLRFDTLEAAQRYLDQWDARARGHTHPRHDQAPGECDVCGGAPLSGCAAA